jgi:hypothetical protein
MDALKAGITAAREGHRAEAHTLLQQALRADPRSEQGWLWMSAVVETDAERRICLERVLTINPHNQTARAGLDQLDSSSGPEHGVEGNLPVSQPHSGADQAAREVVGSALSTDPVAALPSAHSMPTVGMDPLAPSRRPIQRLVPQAEASDGLAQLRAAQFDPSSSVDDPSSSEADSFTALVLIGGLSITAVAGALMLGVLWLIGWPP